MRRIKIALSYDGTDYHGWQVQPGLPTIQGTLEAVLSEIESSPVAVAGSGRTDAGVHALAQVAAFNLENPIPLENLRKAMNRLLPYDIRVTEVEETSLAFHPRFDAEAKNLRISYLSRGDLSAVRAPLRLPSSLSAACGEMIELAPLVAGEHDFSAFAASDERDDLGASKVRTIFCSKLMLEGDRLLYRVTGSGFLKHMVRNIVGVLLEIGKGNIDRDGLLARLGPCSVIPAGPTAPARGLFLISVAYHDTPPQQ